MLGWLYQFYRWICSWWKKPRQVLYEDTFSLEEKASESDENYKKEQVEERTPSGLVRMKYDDVEKCFLYWADNTIPTRYLDTVARKYVTVFDKREWYEKTEVEYKKTKPVEMAGPFVKSKHVARIEIVKKMNRFKKKGGLLQEEIQKIDGKNLSYLHYKNDYANVIFSVDETIHGAAGGGTDGGDTTGRVDLR
jgi:hypothetical protein